MSKKYRLVSCTLLFFASIFISTWQLRAQNNLKFNHITVIDGLLHNSATSIAQDSIGFIWIGTQRGLNRYDGYKLDSYLNETDSYSTLFNNRIRKIAVDGNYLWLSTYNGLQCFDIKQKKFVKFKIENDNSRVDRQNIQTLFVDSKRRLWFGTPGILECALISTDNAEPKLKKLKINNRYELKLKFTDFPEVTELSNKTIFLLLDGKIHQAQEDHSIEKVKTREFQTSFGWIQTINSFKNNLWLFSQNKAIALRQSKNQLLKYDEFNYPDCNILGTKF